MIEVTLAPDSQRPGFPAQAELIEPFGLGGQHFLEVLGGLPELLELIGEVPADDGGDGGLPLAIGAQPAQFGRGAGHSQLRGEFSERLAAHTNFGEAVGRHGHLFELLAGQTDSLGGGDKRFFDTLLSGAELDAGAKDGKLGNTFHAGHMSEGPYAGVADFDQSGADAGELFVGTQGQSGKGAGDLRIFFQAAAPDQPLEDVAVLLADVPFPLMPPPPIGPAVFRPWLIHEGKPGKDAFAEGLPTDTLQERSRGRNPFR
jgi:hypothetical protein